MEWKKKQWARSGNSEQLTMQLPNCDFEIVGIVKQIE